MREITGTDSIAVFSALRDLQWMARRAVSLPAHTTEDRASVDAATSLLQRLLRARRMEPCRPDRIGSRAHQGGHQTSRESIWADGNTRFEPSAGLVEEWTAMTFGGQVQWVADRLHPRAHWYADGRATYATGMFNAATDRLAGAHVDLSVTEASRGRAWVSDAMGAEYAGRGAS